MSILYPNQFVSDTVSAIVASFCVAPFITVIDRSIMQNASGAKASLKQSLVDGAMDLVTKPHRFVRRPEFHMTWALYYVTYQTAHTIASVCENQQVNPFLPKFVGTTLVNSTSCVLKDRAFTRLFGTKAPTNLPVATYLLFFSRDCATNFASFSLPPITSKYLVDEYGIKPERALTISQLACPVTIQIFSSPLHLLGLSLYNSTNATPMERIRTISSQYFGTTLLRCSRIFPAFGIGGELSYRIRNALREFTGVNDDLQRFSGLTVLRL